MLKMLIQFRSLLIYEAARGNLLHNVSKHRRDKKQIETNEDKEKEKVEKEKEKVEKEKVEKEKANRLFVEEGATKYFRRLDFSPDGAFLVTPGFCQMFFQNSVCLKSCNFTAVLPNIQGKLHCQQ